MKQLRLFIWTYFYPDYLGGLAFAIAEDETEARRLVAEQLGCEPHSWGNLEIRKIDNRVARCVVGGG